MVSSKVEWTGRAIYTFYDLDTRETFKGKHTATLRMAIPGGRIGKVATIVSGAPRLRKGDEVLLFARPLSDAGGYVPLGGTDGCVRLDRRKDSKLLRRVRDAAAE